MFLPWSTKSKVICLLVLVLFARSGESGAAAVIGVFSAITQIANKIAHSSNKFFEFDLSLVDLDVATGMVDPTWYFSEAEFGDHEREILRTFPLTLTNGERHSFSFFIDDNNDEKDVCAIYVGVKDHAGGTLPEVKVCFYYHYSDVHLGVTVSFGGQPMDAYVMDTILSSGLGAIWQSKYNIGTFQYGELELSYNALLSCDMGLTSPDKCFGSAIIQLKEEYFLYTLKSTVRFGDKGHVLYLSDSALLNSNEKEISTRAVLSKGAEIHNFVRPSAPRIEGMISYDFDDLTEEESVTICSGGGLDQCVSFAAKDGNHFPLTLHATNGTQIFCQLSLHSSPKARYRTLQSDILCLL
tara:strand:- start:946 stop:2007 length:1062 start_codon:yes stop_codon:yes gene_type:complete